MRIPFKLRLLLFYLNNFTKKTTGITPEEARAIANKKSAVTNKLLDFAPIEQYKVVNRTIPMRDNAEIPIRIYQSVEGDNLPVIVYFHGGGFVLRDIDSHDRVCRRMAHLNKAIVVSVGYRLAPEFKFPTAAYDAYDSTEWVSQNANSFNGDTSRLIVAGDSAGGNLATVTCQMSKEFNGPKIAYQVLIYPCTDARLCHPSIDSLGKDYFLTKPLMQWFIGHYSVKPEDVEHPYMSPYLGKDLSGLPPAFILTAEYDPLKDEGIAYAKRMKEAGVAVKHKDYGGMIHAFINMPKITKVTLQAQDDIREAIKEVCEASVLV